MQKRVIEADGISLLTESAGDASHPAVLLVMGAMASAVWWPEEFCAALAGRGRFVIRYDHRDTGGSTSYAQGSTPYSVEDLADDIVRVLDGYGVEAAHLVGMSLGGYLSQLVALKYPARVITLTLIASERLASADPEMPGIDPELLQYHAKAVELDWSDKRAVVDYHVGAWRLISGSRHAFESELIRSLAGVDWERTADPLTPFNHANLQDATGWTDRMDEITLPVLIIHGTEDRVLPFEHALALKRDLPQARLVKLEGTGHELPRGEWPLILSELERHTGRVG